MTKAENGDSVFYRTIRFRLIVFTPRNRGDLCLWNVVVVVRFADLHGAPHLGYINPTLAVGTHSLSGIAFEQGDPRLQRLAIKDDFVANRALYHLRFGCVDLH